MATRFVVDQTDPVTLAFLRYLIGFCLLLFPAWRSAQGWLSAKELPAIAGLGIVQFGILIVLMNHSLQFIPSARAALIFASVPLLSMTLAALGSSYPVSILRSVGRFNLAFCVLCAAQ